MIEYTGIIIGGVLGFLSAFLSTFLIDFLRARREEKKWKLQSAQEYFRRLYDPLAPFFSIPHKIMWAMLQYQVYQIKGLTKEEQQQVSSNLDGILSEIAEAYVQFVNKGYIGLFPKDVGGMILSLSVRVVELNNLIKEKGIVDEETQKTLIETISVGEKIRDRMRQLLNVDALD